MAEAKAAPVLIKYIGGKEFFADFIAQSGALWNGYGDVQEVTEEQAKKLLAHDDEFAVKDVHDALLIEQAKQKEIDDAAALVAAEEARIAEEQRLAAEEEQRIKDEAEFALQNANTLGTEGNGEETVITENTPAIDPAMDQGQVPSAQSDMPKPSETVSLAYPIPSIEELNMMTKADLSLIASDLTLVLDKGLKVDEIRAAVVAVLYPVK